jgi:hypothetical protein
MPNPISELAQLSWNPNFPDYYGPMVSITTAHWHYISGGKFGDQLFPCCADEPEQLNLAGTVIGQELTSRFQRELASNAAGADPGSAGGPPGSAVLRSSYQLDFEPARLALADFNNNGDTDIMVSGKKPGEFALLLGDGKGGFRQVSQTGRILREFIARRIAGAKLKPAPCRAGTQQSCALALAATASSSAIPVQAELADVNGDGVPDMLLGQAEAQNSAWLRAGAQGRFYLVKTGGHAAKDTNHNPVNLTSGDIDGNGLQDLAFADPKHNSIVFLVAIQPGVFTQATLPLAQTPDAIGLADLNHNGKADLVFINRGSKSVSIMLNL